MDMSKQFSIWSMQLLQNYDDNLPCIISFPVSSHTCYNLRSHGHGLLVSFVKSELHKNIYQQIFSECYKIPVFA